MALAAQKRPSSEVLSASADAKTRICIFGSSEVVRRLADFERSGAIIGSEQSRHIVASLVQGMRKDLGTTGNGLANDDLEMVLFGGERQAGR